MTGDGGRRGGPVGRLTLALTATVQGVATLVTYRRFDAAQSQALLDDAITIFLTGASACR